MTPMENILYPNARDYLVERLQNVIAAMGGGQIPIILDKPRQESWGDYACNVAMLSAKEFRKSPQAIAREIVDRLELDENIVQSADIAGPGFVNFTLAVNYLRAKLAQILHEESGFGKSTEGEQKKVQVEFVSANPTGPLNIVSARAAAVGDSLVRFLKFRGYDAKSEFYINDSGHQVALLGYSMLARIKELRGEPFEIPEQGYHGKYLIPLAKEAIEKTAFNDISDEKKQADFLGRWAVQEIHLRQAAALAKYRVQFDEWYRESMLYAAGDTEKVFDLLTFRKVTYLQDGAWFLATTRFGDQQDRVIKTSDGRYTYFLPDIAYHVNKRNRGFAWVVDILGPDHQTFPGRMKAAILALGFDKDFLDVIILQQVNLLRGGEVVKMSKRSGEMVTMEELLEEVGVDAARFFFCQRKTSAHLDFDIDLALKRTEDNPVYYVQYAHARIASIFRKSPYGIDDHVPLVQLKEPEEIALVKKLLEFPDVVSLCVASLEPQPLTGYLQEVAATYHRFYHEHRVISDDENLSRMRLGLCRATQIVLRNGLDLLGIEAPESM
jgi:arginyl-tRNA synthetase